MTEKAAVSQGAVPLSPDEVSAQTRRMLWVLLVVYIFNFLDRQILSILAVPVKADLGLTDSQLGALGGIAFALLYSTLAVPLAVFTALPWLGAALARIGLGRLPEETAPPGALAALSLPALAAARSA